MKILFAFENPLPNSQADAEVFATTARYLARHATESWLHTPLARGTSLGALWRSLGVPVIRAWAPLSPPALRHFCCGLTLPLRQAFKQADFIYTRNLWVSGLAILFGQRVVFDHYRPWPDQIPPPPALSLHPVWPSALHRRHLPLSLYPAKIYRARRPARKTHLRP